MLKTTEQKYKTVIEKNTFYFYNKVFEQSYEGYLNSIRDILLVLRNKIENEGCKKEHFNELLAENQHGLFALLALTSFSNESFKRLIRLIRVVEDEKLSKLANKALWVSNEELSHFQEWSDEKIAKMVQTNKHFRSGVVNIFFEGTTVPFLMNTLPLFETKKLGITKLQFDVVSMIDTLVRYKVKGSYSGTKQNNAEIVISEFIENLGLTYETGDLTELIISEQVSKRTMDFIIPNKKKPKIIIESSFLVTTSSNQGDKSKTENTIRQLIKKYYPKAKFIGFVDGIGWYVRPQDLRRMVGAYEDVFTFHESELSRFENFLKVEFNIL